jgi:hypothetical protein
MYGATISECSEKPRPVVRALAVSSIITML